MQWSKDYLEIIRYPSYYISLKDCFLTSSIYTSSIFSSKYNSSPLSIALSLSNVRILAKSVTRATESIIASACSSAICAPSSQYTLYPLYSAGLWLAVITIPEIQFRNLTAKESIGVALKSLKRYAFIPLPANTEAASSANSLTSFWNHKQ